MSGVWQTAAQQLGLKGADDPSPWVVGEQRMCYCTQYGGYGHQVTWNKRFAHMRREALLNNEGGREDVGEELEV
jgi:hypothetical protein